MACVGSIRHIGLRVKNLQLELWFYHRNRAVAAGFPRANPTYGWWWLVVVVVVGWWLAGGGWLAGRAGA